MEIFSSNKRKKRGRVKGCILIGVSGSCIDEKEIEIIKVEENLIKTKLKTKEDIFNV